MIFGTTATVASPNPSRTLGRLLGLALALWLGIFAADAAEARRYASIVVDAETGQVLYSRNANTLAYPASLTKMMTLYMAFEALESGKLKRDQQLPVSKRAEGMPPSKLGLQRGQTIKVRDVIMSLVTKSANDAAVVLAEALGGTEIQFARMMTERARELGMSRTTFRNASGLPNRGQKSTARDMARLASALLEDFPQYYDLFSTRSFTYKGRSYRNHNRLLENYPGTDGIKTGYIRASGFNLVASVVRNGRRIIGVVFGGKTSRSRDAHMRKLLDRGFATIAVAGVSTVPPPPTRNPRRPVMQVAAAADPTSQAQASRVQGSRATVEDEGSRDASPPVPQAKPVVIRPSQVAAEAALINLPKPVQSDEAANNPAARQVASTDATTDSPGRAWGIQVGAFRSFSPAHDAAIRAARALPGMLVSTKMEISHVEDDAGSFYRAKLHGLDEPNAREACRRLESRDISCVVIPPAVNG